MINFNVIKILLRDVKQNLISDFNNDYNDFKA